MEQGISTRTSHASRENEFRLLNPMERATIIAAATPKKGKDPKTGLPHRSRIPASDPRIEHIGELQVSYERMQGGFTVCVLILNHYGDDLEPEVVIWRGSSRRSYRDARNPIRGEMLAFSRTVLYSRPVTI